MQDFPHHYAVSADARPSGYVVLSSDGLTSIDSAAPAEFGGPGDRWSPESLLVAAIADCFALSFRAIARASHLQWTSLTCEAQGMLERVERVTQFSAFKLTVTLDVPPTTAPDKALKLLEKAEKSCLISNSLKADSHLKASVRVVSKGKT